VTRLTTEKFVPKFCEKVAEGGRDIILRGGWDRVSRGCWAKPVGSTDGDQSQANATAVPHRTENVFFSTVKVFIYMVNDCTVRVHGLVEFSDIFGTSQEEHTSAGRRGNGKSTLSFLNTGRL